jgi:imidazole glycerol-phosphate synthase subunit HisH
MIGIIDYGMGNLHSVTKAVERMGGSPTLVTTAQEIRAADKIILPGVGAFADAMATLTKRELVEPIIEAVGQGKWFMGICLGMQLLFDTSFEDGQYEGLGIVPGAVVKFDFSDDPEASKLKIPHMGWNTLEWDRSVPFLAGLEPGVHVYFVHSYYVVPVDPSATATTTHYGIDFTSSIHKDNVMATQFHPEKSQAVGMKMLENFVKL